jgi:hypothetical protein
LIEETTPVILRGEACDTVAIPTRSSGMGVFWPPARTASLCARAIGYGPVS